MNSTYLNLILMYSEISFINVEYSSMLDPPDQSKVKPLRSSH